jgi:hypothetical protein
MANRFAAFAPYFATSLATFGPIQAVSVKDSVTLCCDIIATVAENFTGSSRVLATKAGWTAENK